MSAQETVEQKGPLVRVIKIVTRSDDVEHISYISAPRQYFPNQKAVNTAFAARLETHQYKTATLMEMGLETLQGLICPTCDKQGKRKANKKDKIGELDPYSALHPVLVSEPSMV